MRSPLRGEGERDDDEEDEAWRRLFFDFLDLCREPDRECLMDLRCLRLEREPERLSRRLPLRDLPESRLRERERLCLQVYNRGCTGATCARTPPPLF